MHVECSVISIRLVSCPCMFMATIFLIRGSPKMPLHNTRYKFESSEIGMGINPTKYGYSQLTHIGEWVLTSCHSNRDPCVIVSNTHTNTHTKSYLAIYTNCSCASTPHPLQHKLQGRLMELVTSPGLILCLWVRV